MKFTVLGAPIKVTDGGWQIDLPAGMAKEVTHLLLTGALGMLAYFGCSVSLIPRNEAAAFWLGAR